MAGVRPTFAASARSVVQQPRTIFCIQLLSSLMETFPLPSDLYAPDSESSPGAPTEAKTGLILGRWTVAVACIPSNSMHWRTIWWIPVSRFDARGSSSFQMFGPQNGSLSSADLKEESQKSKTGRGLGYSPADGSPVPRREAASRHAVTIILIVGSASRTWLTTHA